jgi:uncharacterized membrane protein (UPF0127 family)
VKVIGAWLDIPRSRDFVPLRGRVERAWSELGLVDLVTLRQENGSVVCEKCALATRPWTRMRGLLGRSGLPEGEGMLFPRTGSVHTMFMRFPIDVVFLDAEMCVLSVREAVPAWRTVKQRGAKAALELTAGEAARVGIAPGDRLVRT